MSSLSNRPLTSITTTSTSASKRPAQSDDFPFSRLHSFPAFYTRQPTLQTRTVQLAKWSSLIQRYHAHQHLFRLHLSTALSTPLFHNVQMGKRVSRASLFEIIDYMCKTEQDGGGGQRAEWIFSGGGSGESNSSSEDKTEAWIWWKRPEDWADVLAGWVDKTGQKGMVLTWYELLNGEAVKEEPWAGMDEEVLGRCLGVLVKKGKAQVFGEEGEKGVKFF
ncbi:MAG: hypothetical protein L6R37_001275 [Teloschistes peruensis]|nr:MAG: hypothetical protein L6R37_001275 [Teloschistes peruensis]